MIDFAAEGLLDGLEGRPREERLELLERLIADGYSVEDLRRSANVALLPAESAVGGPPRYTAREIAEQTGIDVDEILRVRRASGLPAAEPDDCVFIEGDLDVARHILLMREAGLSLEQLLSVARILGRGLSQAATAMRAIAVELAVEPGASELEVALRHAAVAQALTPLTAPLLEHVLQLHLRQSISGEFVDAAERESGRLTGARDVAVGFADLVGFTRLGEKLPPEEIGAVAGRLEDLAMDVIDAPVRLVKTIGDAVMFVAPEPVALVEAALTLVEAADSVGDELPQLRAGTAFGPALGRAGDWYGRPVNLASRLTGAAYPGSVLASAELHEAIGENGYRWSFAGERKLKGIGEVATYRVRHRSPDEEAPGPTERPDKQQRRRRR